MNTDTATPADTARAEVNVSLGARSYDIKISDGLLAHAGHTVAPLLARPVTAIVTDENVAHHHLETLTGSLDEAGIKHTSIILPAGEQTKSYAQLAQVCEDILAAGIERNDHIIAFGGGVIGDLAGFAAAIVRRGIGFIQIPTSLLAQVDSSVGGKTGINSSHGKNLVGAFHQPAAVLADINVLNTLPARELAAGYAEVAKYGLLGDAAFFGWLEDNATRILSGDPQARIHAIRTSCQAKAAIVARDERESGDRALLNLGHTFGHALEAATGYSDKLLHGEGVAIGMAQAFRFSEQLGICPRGAAARMERHLKSVGLPTDVSAIRSHLPDAAELVEIMRRDKKAEAGRINFILVKDVGNAYIDRTIEEDGLVKFLEAELKLK
ncbi:MAG: 3-dehydroquinate synthase [Anderseniella sp.]